MSDEVKSNLDDEIIDEQSDDLSDKESNDPGPGAISIIGRGEPERVRGVFDKLGLRPGVVTAGQLQEQLQNFLTTMQGVMQNVPEYLGQFSLDTVTLTVEVNAKGKISLLGSGGELGGKGGLTFTLKRHPKAEPKG